METKNYLNKTIVFCTQSKYYLLLIFLICVTSNASTFYSEVYNKELEKLVQETPNKALEIASNNLYKAKNDKEKLISLYYITGAYSMLNEFSKNKEAIKEGLALAKKTNNPRFIFEFSSLLIFQYELAGNFQRALELANENYKRAILLEDDRLIAIALNIRGQAHASLGDHQMALKDTEKSLNIFQINNDKSNISNSFNMLAIIYMDLNEFEKSIKFYKESLNNVSASSFDNGIVYYNIGYSYLALEQYNTALEYFKQAIEIASLVNDEYTITFAQNGMADTYLMQEKNDEALPLYLKTIKIFQESNDEQMVFNINLSLAQIYVTKKEFNLAKNYLTAAESQGQILKSRLSIIDLLEAKKTLYQKQNNWEYAYKSLTRLVKLEGELRASNKEDIVEELKVKYNARFDQEKMELLKEQNSLQNSLIKQGNLENKYLTIIIALSSILLLATFYAYWLQKRQKRYLYKLSNTDSLTKSYNRRYIVKYLREITSKKNNNSLDYTVIMVDLDYFKAINDTYGHGVGNKVLVYFTNTVKQHINTIDKVARVGGEEWLIILPKRNQHETKQLLANIREDFIQKTPASIPKSCKLNFSSGVLLTIEPYSNYDQILNDVDKALYKAKNNGRGQDYFETVHVTELA